MSQSILITGGSGFIGNAITQALLEDKQSSVDRICIYSRNEASQAAMRERLGNPDRCRWMIGDVRDEQRLTQAMRGVNWVVHAAALKRVEVGEYNPEEMVRTNIEGARNVIKAAIANRVQSTVAISTDKACEPVNAYGATKLVMEKLFVAAEHYAGPDAGAFSVVRYGNVAGSTGSVIPTWRRALENNERIRITDPECTRYWITKLQAVEVIVAGLQRATKSAIVVPTMPAYRLGDLATAMGIQREQIDVVGLQPGEKRHETLIGAHEHHLFTRDNSGFSTRYTTKPVAAGKPCLMQYTSDMARRMRVSELQPWRD